MAAMPMYDLSTAPLAVAESRSGDGIVAKVTATVRQFYQWLAEFLFGWLQPYAYLWYVRAIPNTMTIMRMTLSTYTVIEFLRSIQSGHLIHAAGWVLATSALAMTDALDGRVAEMFHVADGIGKTLDPLADKILVAQVFAVVWLIMLNYLNTELTMIFTMALAARVSMDLALIYVRWKARGQKLDHKATDNGKVKVHFDYAFLATGFFGLLAVQADKWPAQILLLPLLIELALGTYWGRKSFLDHLHKVS